MKPQHRLWTGRPLSRRQAVREPGTGRQLPIGVRPSGNGPLPRPQHRRPVPDRHHPAHHRRQPPRPPGHPPRTPDRQPAPDGHPAHRPGRHHPQHGPHRPRQHHPHRGPDHPAEHPDHQQPTREQCLHAAHPRPARRRGASPPKLGPVPLRVDNASPRQWS
ncbi:hypothetical protein KCH_64850 [Kitasatospora cheerisanensis KCTC 2395]|uniref:Uncharacterized protein n=1 Tax=Kitasatospora cheerisanensis KCTC 2395 TaxID=1348663 RepID=A0A066YV25_9ACTN|nr:hypothetical protein KCH_64850 [Kitasatospora cheerisanensis KCTC 2395]